MSMRLTNPAVDHPPAPVQDPSVSPLEHDLSIPRVVPVSNVTIVEDGAAVYSSSPAHRPYAAAIIRRLGGRTETALRRELGRFFAARPELSHADRAAIAQSLSRFRNQLLHHPRSVLRAAAAGPAGAHQLLDAVRTLFNLADASPSQEVDQRRPADSKTRSASKS
jgi:Glutamyl-tRNAGlu reductase, dimerisation domain